MKRSTSVHALAIVLLLAAGIPAGAADSAGATRAQMDLRWLVTFAEQVRGNGVEAQLPPHLALELALGSGTSPVPVRQTAARVDANVRTFNVLLGKQRQCVLFNYDEGTQLAEVFLLRSDGALSRAVSYRAGKASSAMPPVAAGAGYRRELKFWRDYYQYGRGFGPPVLTVPLAPRGGGAGPLSPRVDPQAAPAPPDATKRP